MISMKRKSYVCNPDRVLKDKTTEQLDIISSNLESASSKTSQENCENGYQMSYLILGKKVDNPNGIDKKENVKLMTKKIHNQWGVGDKYCNNGVMVLFSKEDREIYVSTGKGSKTILDDYVLQGLIDDILPFFKESKYDEGLLQLAEKISKVLIDNKKPPGFLYKLFWFFVNNWWLLLVLVSVVYGIYTGIRENRRRNEMKEKLKKLEKIRNDILSDKGDKNKNKFNMRECAICIEELDERSEYNRTLYCGHVFHRECVDSWEKTKNQCPICRKPTTGGKDDDKQKHDNDSCMNDFEQFNNREQQEDWLYFSTTNLLYTYRDVSYGYVIPRNEIWTTNYVSSYNHHRTVYLETHKKESSSSFGSSFGGGSSDGGGGSGGSW